MTELLRKVLPRRDALRWLAGAGLGLVSLGGGLFAYLRNKEEEKVIKGTFRLGFPWQTQDPFLFCAYHKDDYPKGEDGLAPAASHLEGRDMGQDFTIKDGFRMYHGRTVPGFPVHPHRGFETVTVVRKGRVDHADSLGAAGRYGDGDVQWMTAGAGIQHSEMFPLLMKDSDNPAELFQVWLNLPRKDKMVPPDFKMLWSEERPVYEKDGARVEIIAGEFAGLRAPAPPKNSWAARAENDVRILVVFLEPGAELTLPGGEAESTRTLYFYRGESVRVADQVVGVDQGIDLEAGGDAVLKNESGVQAALLMLHGRPIQEPVFQRGPFVMNSKEEIIQTIHDYQRTSFGGWPWDREDVVHGERDRFAKYPDGREELPPKA